MSVIAETAGRTPLTDNGRRMHKERQRVRSCTVFCCVVVFLPVVRWRSRVATTRVSVRFVQAANNTGRATRSRLCPAQNRPGGPRLVTDRGGRPSSADRVCLVSPTVTAQQTAAMGRIFLDHVGGDRLYACAACDTNLTNRDELISTRFTGATGRAFLFNKVVNLNYR